MSTSSEQIALRLSRGFGLMCVFGIAWSNAFFRVGLAGLIVASLFSGVYRDHGRRCLRQPVAWLALGFFAMVLAGTVLAGHPAEMAFYDVEHYRKLLMIPVFAVVFQSAREHRQLLLAYGLGVVVLMLRPCSTVLESSARWGSTSPSIATRRTTPRSMACRTWSTGECKSCMAFMSTCCWRWPRSAPF